MDLTYISNFLSRVEGSRQTVGYIPCHLVGGGTANYKGGPNPERYRAMGASGVTIATGCDLGQTDAATLMYYGLAPALVQLFTAYYGKKREAAIAALYARPLRIDEAQAQAVDEAVHGGYLRRWVIPAYEKAAGKSFDALPRQAQAVIMSLCFQKGCGGVARDWPVVWGHLVAGRWPEAAQELRTGFKQYAGRRRTEGNLLLEVGAC